MLTFAKQLKSLRQSNDLRQKDLAEELGLTLNQVSDWELSRSIPNIEQLTKLAEYFNVSADSLLGLEPPPTIFAKAPTLEPDELQLLEAYNELTPGKKKALFQMLDIRQESENNKKKGG